MIGFLLLDLLTLRWWRSVNKKTYEITNCQSKYYKSPTSIYNSEALKIFYVFLQKYLLDALEWFPSLVIRKS